MFQTGEINTGSFQGPGALKTIDLAHGSEVKTLLEFPPKLITGLLRRILFLYFLSICYNTYY